MSSTTAIADKVWVNDEYHGWICLESAAAKRAREQVELQERRAEEQKKIAEDLKKAEEEGNSTEEIAERKKKFEERVKEEDEESAKKEKERLEKEEKEQKEKEAIRILDEDQLVKEGDLVFLKEEDKVVKVNKKEGKDLKVIDGELFKKVQLEAVDKIRELKVRIHIEEGTYELGLQVNVNQGIQDFIGQGSKAKNSLRALLKEKVCFSSANAFLDNFEVAVIERPQEKKKEEEELKKEDGEAQQEEKKEEDAAKQEGGSKTEEMTEKEVETPEEKPAEAEEANKNEEKEDPKEQKKEEGGEAKEEAEKVAEEKKEEEKEDKEDLTVPADLIDSKAYHISQAETETFGIYSDARVGNIAPLFSTGLDILVIRPTELSLVQLYDRVLYKLSSDPGCTFTVAEEIYLHGFGLYGPFPNGKGVQAFDYVFSVYNARTRERQKMTAKVENQDERVYKFFLEKPMNVARSDMVHISKVSGQGAVFVLESEQCVFVGDDDVHFRLTNHLNNMVASLYYSKPEEEAE
jgi:chemotaxis protein histidine kinase CheA